MASTTLMQGIQVYLKTVAALKTYISDRIYWLSAPDGTADPYITYHGVTQDNTGAEIGEDKDSVALVQFDIWSTNQYKALNIANVLITTLQEYSGSLDGINVLKATTSGPIQTRDPDFDHMFHFIVDVDFNFYRK